MTIADGISDKRSDICAKETRLREGAKGALERGKRCARRFLARAVVGFCGNEDIMSLPPAFWDPFLVWGALC